MKGESEVLGRYQMAVSQQCTAALQLESKLSAAGQGRKAAWSKTQVQRLLEGGQDRLLLDSEFGEPCGVFGSGFCL